MLPSISHDCHIVSTHYGKHKSKNKNICDALRDLLPFVQFKKRENIHGGILLLVKLTLLLALLLLKATFHHGYFLCFLNCTNCNKSCKSHINRYLQEILT